MTTILPGRKNVDADHLHAHVPRNEGGDATDILEQQLVATIADSRTSTSSPLGYLFCNIKSRVIMIM